MTSDATAKPTPAPGRATDVALDYAVQLGLLAAIVTSSDDAIVSKTLEGRILSWNAGATRIFGYEAEEVIGKPITIIIPPELHGQESEILAKLRRGERIEHFDTVRVAKDGHRIDVSLSVSPVRNAQGIIVAASKVARDVSARKRAEQALRASEQRLATEVHALARLSDLTGRLWSAGSLDEGVEEMLGAVIELLKADKGVIQLLGVEEGVLLPVAQRGFEPDFLEFFRGLPARGDPAYARALRLGERIIIEDVETDAAYEPLRAAARRAGFRAVVSSPLHGADGTAFGIITTQFQTVHRPSASQLARLDMYLRHAGDFIQRVKVNDILRQSEAALREADRRKDEFLAVLAHELRNPLAPIRYALATAKRAGCTPEQQKRAEEVVERQVAHMSRLIDDLLDISRITHGTLELQKSCTELTSVIGAAIETARPLIDSKRHNLTLDLPKQAVQLEADPIRLAQVFANLLINAAKYTEPGGHIELEARQAEHEIVVTVRDDGMGIPAEIVPQLFTLFGQAHPTTGRAQEGLGVGLSLVRGLVELHGGSVQARSDGPGRGSAFSVRLPVTTSVNRDAEQTTPAAEADGPALRILVVDDSRDAADTCATLLGLSGHCVRTAYSGRQTLEVAETFHPNVLLLDIGLPDIDGYQLARRIRSAPWGRAACLIALTGWGQDEDRRRASEVGFDHHLTKPAPVEALDSLLRSLDLRRSLSSG
jgi:PAS domain S-box-containing protein